MVGGGVSKHAAEFLPLIRVGTPIVPATLKNTAGIVGAAVLAHEMPDMVPAGGQPGSSRAEASG